MATNPTKPRFNWRVIAMRAIGLLLFTSGLVEVFVAAENPEVRYEVPMASPQDTTKTTTPDGVELEIVTSSMVEIRLNPLFFLAGLQITAGLALLWLAREKPQTRRG